METGAFRWQAERCRRLAKSIYNFEVAADLEAYAQELERRAAALEGSQPSSFGEAAEAQTGLC